MASDRFSEHRIIIGSVAHSSSASAFSTVIAPTATFNSLAVGTNMIRSLFAIVVGVACSMVISWSQSSTLQRVRRTCFSKAQNFRMLQKHKTLCSYVQCKQDDGLLRQSTGSHSCSHSCMNKDCHSGSTVEPKLGSTLIKINCCFNAEKVTINLV